MVKICQMIFRSAPPTSWLCAAVILMASFPAAAQMPSGMLFFMPGNTCPQGSSRAANTNGRLLLVANDAGAIGRTYGDPLKDQEDRQHAHDDTMTVSLSAKSISGTSSCCNARQQAKAITPPKRLVSKQYVTGKCDCKKGGSVLFTASATLCTTPNHPGCTSAKAACVQQQGATCRGQGGTISQSGATCTYGAKC
jgi:hypothetical protein